MKIAWRGDFSRAGMARAARALALAGAGLCIGDATLVLTAQKYWPLEPG